MRAKQIAYHRPDEHRIEHRWTVWLILAWIVLAGVCVWAVMNHIQNHRYVVIGKAVQCVDRPSYEYFRFCNAQMDGSACMWANQSRMLQWYDEIDYACAQFEPERKFRFPVSNPERDTLEVAEAG